MNVEDERWKDFESLQRTNELL
uniref:Uncharacterized protein n=1 Tax=Nelumbo nucifera TaxID=4432 RepID=A0A822XYX5_NELNU|nr:TPA_asm: hypothetical protein HUJ06_028302 [Nelumbo nucifera]